MGFDAEAAVDVATSIAHHLCDTAFEHDGKTTWMGMSQGGDERSEELEFTFETLGPELYDGTSGIALFFAEMWKRSGNPRFRDAAASAIRHALSKVGTIPNAFRFGFYSGRVGVAYAAARVGDLFGEPSLIARAAEALADLAFDSADRPRLDVLDGAAGAAPALLLLADWMANPRLTGLARDLGHVMLESATRRGDGWSWRDETSGNPAAPHLTGLSHGAAGFGWSLLELHRVIQEPAFHHAAMQAFRYEGHCFREDLDNWPDFRGLDTAEPRAHCAVAWCHGAPGIGLTRLRALELEGAERLRRDAEAAVRSTMHEIRETGDGRRSDFSPCHGFAGCGEFLLRAADAFGDPRPRELVLEVAAAGATRYAHAPGSWPCGVIRGGNPSLMLGLAGIGYFYLRIADPKLPSLLLLAPSPGGALRA